MFSSKIMAENGVEAKRPLSVPMNLDDDSKARKKASLTSPRSRDMAASSAQSSELEPTIPFTMAAAQRMPGEVSSASSDLSPGLDTGGGKIFKLFRYWVGPVSYQGRGRSSDHGVVPHAELPLGDLTVAVGARGSDELE